MIYHYRYIKVRVKITMEAINLHSIYTTTFSHDYVPIYTKTSHLAGLLSVVLNCGWSFVHLKLDQQPYY